MSLFRVKQRRVSWRRVRLILSSGVLLLSVGNFFHQATKCCPKSALNAQYEYRRLSEEKPRILYIVTSLSEYDNGRRETQKGYDRFSNTMMPMLRESINSMMESGYKVDVYLICHFSLRLERYDELRRALPKDIGLEVWDDATPIGYAVEFSKTNVTSITRALARQHRYVIKDKLLDYAIFVSFEDDMLIKGDHIQNFVEVTNELYRLRQEAPDELDNKITAEKMLNVFHGPMTKSQLNRMIPGLFRVEAALPGWKPQTENLYEQIPIDYEWDNKTASIDSSICCHVSNMTANDHIPLAPDVSDLYFWETSIDALGVRKLPDDSNLGWALLQVGNVELLNLEPYSVIGDYWSGNDYKFTDLKGSERPPRSKGRYVNNQGGWMATQRQIWEWHSMLCVGGFLPPYEEPAMPLDGLEAQNVEFWSGGLHIFGPRACNLQRIIPLEPERFSKALLYHSSNNKQRQENVQHKFSSRSINDFWGQLNTVRKNAERSMGIR